MRVCALPAGMSGVAFYRIHQPFNYLKSQGKPVYIFDATKDDGWRLQQEQAAADVIIYQCPWSESMLGIMDGVKAQGKKVVIELDDNLFAVNPWNEKYSAFGFDDVEIEYKDPESQRRIELQAKDLKIKEGKNGSKIYTMWESGKHGFDKEANRRKAEAISRVLCEADLVTVTTPELGFQLRKFRPHGPIVAIPNLIDPKRWLPMKKNDTEFLRIGWQGGSAHFHDLYMIANELKDVLRKNPKVKLVIAGVQFYSLFEDFLSQVEWVPWHGDISTYPLMIRNLKLDIALCPLEDDTFNRGKSPLKWEEMSVMGVPCVASPIVYGKFIKHGKTGFIAEKGQWAEYLQELISDPEKRSRIAKNAQKEVLERFNVQQSEMWWSALQDLMYGKMSDNEKLGLTLNMN